MQRAGVEASHLKALSSLDTMEDKLDYIDVHFEPGSWLCKKCNTPRPATESKCQAMTKTGQVSADGSPLWAHCTGSQVVSWGGLIRESDRRPEGPRAWVEFSRVGEKRTTVRRLPIQPRDNEDRAA